MTEGMKEKRKGLGREGVGGRERRSGKGNEAPLNFAWIDATDTRAEMSLPMHWLPTENDHWAVLHLNSPKCRLFWGYCV